MSLGASVRSVVRSYKKKFPGVSDADLNELLKLHLVLVADNLKAADADLAANAEHLLSEAADNGETWAVNLRDAVLVNVIKPVVDKAAEKGVDPVPALVLQVDISEAQARDYVAVLTARAAQDDQTPDPAPSSEPAAPAYDPFSSAAA